MYTNIYGDFVNSMFDDVFGMRRGISGRYVQPTVYVISEERLKELEQKTTGFQYYPPKPAPKKK